MRINEIPKADRPREKLSRLGAPALTDAELLAIFLRTGTRGRSALAMAAELLETKGSLDAIAKCEVAELAGAIPGLGPAKAAELKAAVELGNRLARGGAERPEVDSAEAAYRLFGSAMRASAKEVLKVIMLDTKLRLLADVKVAEGSLNECVAHPREILLPAVVRRAYAIIVMHNHPSGDPAPSKADHSLTRRLREAAEILQITLLDHVIVGTSEGGRLPYFSFREAGVL